MILKSNHFECIFGLGDVRLSYTKKPYFIVMQTFQIALLISFETADTMSYKDIREATRLSDDQFSRHLQSLIECKLLECDDKVASFNKYV